MIALHTTNDQSRVILSNRKVITLPIHYENWKWMMATFTAPTKQIKRLLPEGLEPIIFIPGKSLLSFGTFEYPEVSALKPYNEFLVSIPVQYKPFINLPFVSAFFDPLFPSAVYHKGASYIYYLPVTTAESCIAGKEIWGFPKVIRKMEFKEENDIKTCKLMNNGKMEMEISIEKLAVPDERKEFTYCSYTEKEGKLIRTCVNAKGNYRVKKTGIKATVKFGQGMVSEQLRHLELSENPVHVFFAENVESNLPEGKTDGAY